MAEKPELPTKRLNAETQALLAIEVAKLLHGLNALDADEVLRLAANATAGCSRVDVSGENLKRLHAELAGYVAKQSQGQTRQ